MQHKLVARLRYAAVLAGMAALTGLAAACSSGSPSASSGAGTAADLSVSLSKLVQCLHAHGERGVYLSHAPSSPNPGSTLIIFHGFAIQGADPGSAQFTTAMQACQHLMPHGIPNGTEQHQQFLQGVQAAQCLRSHGYPTWPDPSGQNGGNFQEIPTGIDMNSPQFQAAAKRCGVSLPPGSG
jgi:hypothetical protein